MSDEVNDDEERRALLRHLIDRDTVPVDIVPTGLTRDAVLRMNAAVGTPVQLTTPGEVLLDPAGMPLGVEASSTETILLGGGAVTRSQLVGLGLRPEDVPNLTVMDNPRRSYQ